MNYIYNINRNKSIKITNIIDVPVQGLKCPVNQSLVISVLKNKEI